jgi:hypothetical protein
MSRFSSVLILLTLTLCAVGLVKPRLTVRRGFRRTRRGSTLLIIGTSALMSLILVAALVPAKPSASSLQQSSAPNHSAMSLYGQALPNFMTGQPSGHALRTSADAGTGASRNASTATAVATRTSTSSSSTKSRSANAAARSVVSHHRGSARTSKSIGATLRIVASHLYVHPGDYASVTVQTRPGAWGTIRVVYKSGPSKAKGLVPKTADPSGRITWTWKVGTHTTRGDWPVTITVGSQVIHTTLHVR